MSRNTLTQWKKRNLRAPSKHAAGRHAPGATQTRSSRLWANARVRSLYLKARDNLAGGA